MPVLDVLAVNVIHVRLDTIVMVDDLALDFVVAVAAVVFVAVVLDDVDYPGQNDDGFHRDVLYVRHLILRAEFVSLLLL